MSAPVTHPSGHAAVDPDRIAYRMAGSGEALTYGELDRLSNQGAQLLRRLGLKAGEHIAFIMENSLAFMELCWACQRSGIYYTAISRYLTSDEIAYIVRDCGAKVLVVTPQTADQVEAVRGDKGLALFIAGGRREGFRAWNDERAAMPATPVADETGGFDMLYSSGTTGRPKGVQEALRASAHRPALATPQAALPGYVRHGGGEHLPLAGAALSCGAAALQHDACHRGLAARP